MERSYSITLAIVRGVGLLAVVMGLISCANIAIAGLLLVLGTPLEVLNPLLAHAMQGLLSGPIWLIAGIIILSRSARLATFVLKGVRSGGS